MEKLTFIDTSFCTQPATHTYNRQIEKLGQKIRKNISGLQSSFVSKEQRFRDHRHIAQESPGPGHYDDNLGWEKKSYNLRFLHLNP
jgi:hypothetical protein